jgi:hypothetical protein
MTVATSQLPIAVDPLIAEAKRRMHRRRWLLALASLAVAGAAVSYALATHDHAGTSPHRAAPGGAACAGSPAALGSVRPGGPYAQVGWGTCAPAQITNGGDASSSAWNLRWSHWGAAVALAQGTSAVWSLSPTGWGRITLRASDIGRCAAQGRQTYRRLEYRIPIRKAGPLGRWHLWSGLNSVCASY